MIVKNAKVQRRRAKEPKPGAGRSVIPNLAAVVRLPNLVDEPERPGEEPVSTANRAPPSSGFHQGGERLTCA